MKLSIRTIILGSLLVVAPTSTFAGNIDDAFLAGYAAGIAQVEDFFNEPDRLPITGCSASPTSGPIACSCSASGPGATCSQTDNTATCSQGGVTTTCHLNQGYCSCTTTSGMRWDVNFGE